jgi:hypothetical protein
VPDRSSSPEAALLARLARLHRSEAAPAAARARFAENIARLETALPAAVRRPRLLRAAVWVPLAAMAAAALAWLPVRPERVTPLREPAPVPSTAQPVSLSGVAVPGTLRWRDGAAGYDSNERRCLYRFSLQPAGSPAIEVHWKQCTFPAELRAHTQRLSSSISGELRISVTGHWLEPERLEASELRVLP